MKEVSREAEMHEETHEQDDKEGTPTEATSDAPPAGASAQNEADLQTQLDAALSEASEFKDKYLRVAADLENIRRRHEREKQDLRQFALESFMQQMLPVLDSFDKALPSAGADSESENEGFALIKKQLHDVLTKHGLATVDADGCAFDPNVHQAIQRIEQEDVESEVVGEEFQRGYLLGERLIRPAMVSVKVPGSKQPESSEKGT